VDWRGCNGEAEDDAVNARMAAREVAVKCILDWGSECLYERVVYVDGWCRKLVSGVPCFIHTHAILNTRFNVML
jgi:hypothetical protein